MVSFFILILFLACIVDSHHHHNKVISEKGVDKRFNERHHKHHKWGVKSKKRHTPGRLSHDLTSPRLSSLSLPYCMVDGFYDVTWSTLEPERSDTYYNSLPLGNGKMAASVYFTGSTGTIGFITSHPDSFNEAGQMIKTGRLEYTLSPNPFGKGREVGGNYHTYGKGKEIYQRSKSRKLRKGSSHFRVSKKLTKDNTHVYGDNSAEGDNVRFNITLQVRSASIRLVSSTGWDITMYIAADVNIGVLNVTSAPSGGTLSNEMYPIRTTNLSSSSFQMCTDYNIPPDTLYYYANDSVRILKDQDHVEGKLCGVSHRNYDAGYVRDTITQLNVFPALSVVEDPFTNLTSACMYLPTKLGKSSALGTFIFSSMVKKTERNGEELIEEMMEMMQRAHPSFEIHSNMWDALWARGYVCFPKDSRQYIIGQQYTLQRMLQLMTAGTTNPVKFNGLLYTAQRVKPDYRLWGTHNWWQNLRFPYYNMLGTGDYDYIKQSLFNYFDKSSNFAKLIAKHWFNFTNDALVWHEYTDVIGTMLVKLYGCDRGGKPFSNNMPYWYNDDPWTHYDWQGILDLSMIIMDATDYEMNTVTLEQYGYIINGITEFYMQKFPTGTIYPSQALETWQCPGYPPNENNCVTNDASTLSGLHAVIPRALYYGTLIYPADRVEVVKAWYKKLPPVPLDRTNSTILPCEKCPSHTENYENVELYSVHPYRVAMVGTPLYDAAVNSRKVMRFPSDYGWNQNALDAALLGLVNESSDYVYKRATAAHAQEYRFQAFMPHYQDYPPSGDHLAVMNSALHYMIASPLPFNATTDTIDLSSPSPSIPGTYLLTSWDCTWDVLFRVHIIGGAVIDGEVSNGKLRYNFTTGLSGVKPKIVQLNCN